MKRISILILVMITAAFLLLPQASAAPEDCDVEAVLNNTMYYLAEACSNDACTEFYSYGGAAGGAIPVGGGIYASGLSGPVNMEQFVTAVLKNIAIKTGTPENEVVTQEHIIALLAFARMEGGGQGDNLGRFNPFNTKYQDSEIKGVKVGQGVYKNEAFATLNYPSLDVGIEATTRTIVNNTYQTRLISVLTDGGSTAENFMDVLTHFQRYEGNKAWAAASDPKVYGAGADARYLKMAVSVVKGVRANYANYASVKIAGTGSGEAPAPTGFGGAGSPESGIGVCGN